MILSDKMDCRRDLIVIVVTNVLYYYSRASVISIIEQRIALFFGLHDGFFVVRCWWSDFLVFRYP